MQNSQAESRVQWLSQAKKPQLTSCYVPNIRIERKIKLMRMWEE